MKNADKVFRQEIKDSQDRKKNALMDGVRIMKSRDKSDDG
jgi:hypothetical protein